MKIPRLELTAATISVRIGGMVSRELDDPVDSETYWTDSTTVLKYIRNEAKRFHVFVANRVQNIRDQTDPAQWWYVESKNNPADDALRGLNGYQLSDQQRWIKGPDFLWLSESEWPEPSCVLNSQFSQKSLKSQKSDTFSVFCDFCDFSLKSQFSHLRANLDISPKSKNDIYKRCSMSVPLLEKI